MGCKSASRGYVAIVFCFIPFENVPSFLIFPSLPSRLFSVLLGSVASENLIRTNYLVSESWCPETSDGGRLVKLDLRASQRIRQRVDKSDVRGGAHP